MPEQRDEAFTFLDALPEDARPASVFRWHAAGDNYEPYPRKELSGYAVRYVRSFANPYRAENALWIPAGSNTDLSVNYLRRAVILLDTGKNVTPYYCAGWRDERTIDMSGGIMSAIFHSFPVNGAPRADNGQPANFDYWRLGPCTALHLKATEVSRPLS